MNIVKKILAGDELRPTLFYTQGGGFVGWSALSGRVKLPNLIIVGGDSLTGFSRLLYENDYDMVIIDGPRNRMKIFEKLLNTETANRPRLIVYDDTDNIENRKALAKSVTGYETYVFRGFKPQTVHACETTVFRYNSI